MRRPEPEPFKRTGICCGASCRKRERLSDQVLYRLREHVYRCRSCYRREAGYFP